jgi:hypothetical protein
LSWRAPASKASSPRKVRLDAPPPPEFATEGETPELLEDDELEEDEELLELDEDELEDELELDEEEALLAGVVTLALVDFAETLPESS